MKLYLVLAIVTFLAHSTGGTRKLQPPIVINTWNFTSANDRAWQELASQNSALDAIEFGCGQCELERCDGTVGWGGSPSESGETTLDAMIMDGETYNVGAVAGLRNVRGAIKVARLVLERTNHTLLVGEMATSFALQMGMKQESLSSNESRTMFKSWLESHCQPNYWINVEPDPRKFCGPYKPIPIDHDKERSVELEQRGRSFVSDPRRPLTVGHDTIGMIARDMKGYLASGTSTNGLRYKIPGRVGDSPIAGAGSYAARDAGAAAATGDGDVMMRHLLSFAAVQNLRHGMNANEAAKNVITNLARRSKQTNSHAALVVLSSDGTFGAACMGYDTFPYVVKDALEHRTTYLVRCLK